MDAEGNAVLSLGKEIVPHGQEVRVADFIDGLPGPEMALRHEGHTPSLLVVSSEDSKIVKRLQLNPSPTNVGMEPVFWEGPDRTALLYNGGWLWDLKTGEGSPLPGLPPPNGGDVHRMGFYHCIPADLAGDEREEMVLWDPAATAVYIFSNGEISESEWSRYSPGPRQYNARLMD